MKMPLTSEKKKQQRGGSEGTVVINKMFAGYDKDRESYQSDMESYVDEDGRMSEASCVSEVQMVGRMYSTESRGEGKHVPATSAYGWALM